MEQNTFDVQENKTKHSKITLIVVVVVLLIVIASAVVLATTGKFNVFDWINHSAQKFLNISSEPEVANLQIKEKATAGKLIEGFSPSLIIAKDAVVGGSVEDTSTKPNVRVFVTTYTTKTALTELSKQYKDYFEANKWTVTKNLADAEKLSIEAFKLDYGSVQINNFNPSSTKMDGFFIVVKFDKLK
jgi:hypothetical protein